MRYFLIALLLFCFMTGCGKPKDPCDILDDNADKGLEITKDAINKCTDFLIQKYNAGDDLITYVNGGHLRNDNFTPIVEKIKFFDTQKDKSWRMKCTPKTETELSLGGLKLKLLFIVAEHAFIKDNNSPYKPATELSIVTTSSNKEERYVPSVELKKEAGGSLVDVRLLANFLYINKETPKDSHVYFGDRLQIAMYINDMDKSAFHLEDFAIAHESFTPTENTIEYLKNIDFDCVDEVRKWELF